MIDYRTTSFETAAKGINVVFDTVGGETLERSWGVLKSGGRLVTIATQSETSADQRVRDAFFIMEPNRAQLIEIARLIDAGKLRPPTVGAVFWMAQAREAYTPRNKDTWAARSRCVCGKNRGKLKLVRRLSSPRSIYLGQRAAQDNHEARNRDAEGLPTPRQFGRSRS